MIKRLILVLIISTTAIVGVSQKYAFVDTQYILENLPEFTEAQRQLDEKSEQWYKEIEGAQKDIQKKRDIFEAEKVLLPDEDRLRKEKELEAMTLGLMELQKKRFGVNGELFLKRQELIEPIQDKIYKAIKAMSEKGNYSFIFDSSASTSNILYADQKYDKSDLVLRNLKK